MRFGYFVDAVDLFDAGAFQLAASEASAMDPQTRICLEQTQAGASLKAMQACQTTPVLHVTVQRPALQHTHEVAHVQTWLSRLRPQVLSVQPSVFIYKPCKF